jgi:hypothetical protein
MLDEDQHSHIERLLIGLDEVKNKLRGSVPGFVEQTQENFEKYGRHLRLSQKQLAWLERLYTEHVGPLD